MNRFDRDILFLETLRRSSKARHRLKKQTGGPGHFAVVELEVRPLARDSGFRFVDSVVEGRIPNAFVPAVEKGARKALARGPIGGFPVVDVEVELLDGQAHKRDSHAVDFETAGLVAVQAAMAEAQPAILEPMGLLELGCPVPSVGFALGRLAARRSSVVGTGFEAGLYVIRAMIPILERKAFEAELSQATSGTARCSVRPSSHAVMPDALVSTLFGRRP